MAYKKKILNQDSKGKCPEVLDEHTAWWGIHACPERAQLLKAVPSVLSLLILQDKPANTFLKKCPKNNALNI